MFLLNQFVGHDVCLEDTKAQLGLEGVTFEMTRFMDGKKIVLTEKLLKAFLMAETVKGGKGC